MKTIKFIPIICIVAFMFSCSDGGQIINSPSDKMLNDLSESKYDITKLASESYIKTFNKKPENIKITKVKSYNYEKGDALKVFYKDNNGNESTFMILTNKKYQSLDYNGQQHLVEKDHYIVDCTGSCDCRERFYPKDGSIECTCSPCQMEVEEIEP